MTLLTPEMRRQIPPRYSQESNRDPKVACKFFCPWNNWTWFVTEGSAEEGDYLFFGFVIGFEEEWEIR